MNKTCKICGSSTREFIHNRTKTLYYHCPICDLIQRDEECFPSKEKELSIYKLHENSIDREDYVAYLKKFVDQALIPFIKEGADGLDYGSGPVPVLSQVLKRDYALKTDIYDYYFAPETIYHGKNYDFIVSTEVIEHLQDPLKSFHLFKEILVQGGILSLMTLFHPQSDGLFQEWWYTRDESHISFYTPKTIKYLARTFSFEIIFTDNIRCITLRKKY